MKYLYWQFDRIRPIKSKTRIRSRDSKGSRKSEEKKFLDDLANNTPNSEQFDKN